MRSLVRNTGLGFITSHRLLEYVVKKLRSSACCRQENTIFHLIFTQLMGSNISQPSTVTKEAGALVKNLGSTDSGGHSRFFQMRCDKDLDKIRAGLSGQRVTAMQSKTPVRGKVIKT